MKGSTTFLVGEDGRKEVGYEKPAGRKKIIFGGIIAVVCLAVIIGLGVGLGLKSTGTAETDTIDNTTDHRCRNKDDLRPADTSPGTKWMDTDCSQTGVCPEGFSSPPLLLISLDGFRADYLLRNFTPAIKRLSECGVHAKHMRSIFPSNTFPNHYSIVTGLYSESHGIIDNNMYDRDKKERFSLSSDNKFNSHWWGGDPIWLTAMRQGKKAGTFFWPGSDVAIQGTYPDICYNYDGSVPFRDRIGEILGWLDLPKDERPDFMTLYFNEPDWTGHDDGPYGDELNNKLHEVDDMIELLMDGLVKRNLHNCINIIIVADHGMEEVACKHMVRLRSYINTNDYYIYDGAYGRITSSYVFRDGEIVEQTDGDTPDEIVEKLECRNEFLGVNKKQDIPRRHHFSNNKRIDEVIMDVKAKWLISRTGSYSSYCAGGNHGYDQTLNSMHALFVAYGRDIAQLGEVDAFDNIEIYNLMADLLGITPSPNNGTAGSLRHLMKNPPSLTTPPPPEGAYSTCPFPSQEEEEQRRNSTTCTCTTLATYTNKSEEELNDQLDLSAEASALALAKHLPTGTPEINMADTQPCQLAHTDYISGYSHEYRMPLWTAYQLNGEDEFERPNLKSRLDRLIPDCSRADVRLPVNKRTECSSYNDPDKDIVPGFLFPPGFSNSTDSQFDALVSSNMVPMFRGFADGVWRDAMLLVEEYSYKYKTVQVTAGPLFDYDADGHRDILESITERAGADQIPVPSHYYVALTKCETNPCPKPQTMSMIIPHKKRVGNCHENDTFSYLQLNTARARDVELLTGLNLFTSVSQQQRIQMLIHLEEHLWDRNSWLDPDTCTVHDASNCPAGTHPLLLISFDGFHPDYLLRNLTPTIKRLYDCGTSAPAMRSVYPTLTFPNHYTQVTGLYPESHGIISNSMYDLSLEAYYSISTDNKSDPRWWYGEPFWNTVEKNNKTSMAMMWVGSEFAIQNMRPTHYQIYNGTIDNDDRVDTVLSWLDGSEGVKPDFITLYFSSVDYAGHEGGPESGTVDDSLIHLDKTTKRLMDSLYRRGTHNCVNIIIVSDHGMNDINCKERQSGVREHINERNMHVWEDAAGRVSNKYRSDRYNGPFYPVDQEDQVPVDRFIEKLECKIQAVKVFEKQTFPKRHHYANSHRIDDVILDVDDRWLVTVWRNATHLCGLRGMHGNDEVLHTMKAFFLAHGPDFAKEKEIEEFENIELYNIMARVLDVPPAPNNGTEGALYPILKNPPSLPVIDITDRYSICSYRVLNGHNNSCPCTLATTAGLNERLNRTEIQNNQSVSDHLPHGVPVLNNNDTVCILYHDDYVSAYSHQRKIALWSAFTLDRDQLSDIEIPDCVRADPRVDQADQTTCDDYTSMEDQRITRVSLFPPKFSSSNQTIHDAMILTNSVPMYSGSVIWDHVITSVAGWARDHGRLHVIVGPVFDYDFDGHWDPVSLLHRDQVNNTGYIPSHYYLVALKCNKPDCTTDMDYDVQAFILPNIDRTLNCMQSRLEDYLEDNTARIRDIELLTGLQFLTAHNTQQGLLARLRLQQRLWTKSS